MASESGQRVQAGFTTRDGERADLPSSPCPELDVEPCWWSARKDDKPMKGGPTEGPNIEGNVQHGAGALDGPRSFLVGGEANDRP